MLMIRDKIAIKAEGLLLSSAARFRFTLCGTRCEVTFDDRKGLGSGHKSPLMSGYEHTTAEALAEYVYRFQF